MFNFGVDISFVAGTSRTVRALPLRSQNLACREH
jgi:hypothetical protein